MITNPEELTVAMETLHECHNTRLAARHNGGEDSLGPYSIEKTEPPREGFSLISECPCPRKEVRQSHGRREGAHYGLLSGEVWETWPQPKLSIRCVRKSNTTPSQ